MTRTAIIEIDNLSKTFRNADSATVKGISFSIGENEIFGLLGPNGAGKTTTISILCGLFPPSGGQVLVAGKCLFDHLAEIKPMIGIVPQDIALYPTLTARENLDFFGHMYGLSGKDLKETINYWLHQLGLYNAADRKVSTYSGGMKRRVNLVAGILHTPKILFLDEPTVGVDVQTRNVIMEQLVEINKAGTTIIYTSHHMEEAENFCTKVCILDDGRIIAEGSPDQLVSAHTDYDDLEDVFLSLTKRKMRD